MADNIAVTAGSGTTIAADDIGGVLHQRVKLSQGADGSATDVSSAAPLQVTLANTGANTNKLLVTPDLPATASTSTKQDTMIGHLDGVEGLLTTLSGAVAGTEMQVDVVAALPAGTNAIGKLAANSGVDIGDVDVTTLPATVHSADYDTGAGTDTTLTFGIAVPASGGAAVVPGDATAGLKVDLGADNDVTVTGSVAVTNAGLTELAAAINASSQMDVNIVASSATLTVGAHAVTNAGTFAVQESGGSLTALQIMDDWDESDRAKVNPIAGQAGVAGGAGASSATTQRFVEANDAGKTLVSKAGTVASSGNNTLISAGTNRLKIHAFSLSTASNTAVTCIFQNGASGTALWQVLLQAPASVTTGANLAVTPPAWLFATSAATLLNLNLSSAQTVHYSLSYVDEA